MQVIVRILFSSQLLRINTSHFTIFVFQASAVTLSVLEGHDFKKIFMFNKKKKFKHFLCW